MNCKQWSQIAILLALLITCGCASFMNDDEELEFIHAYGRIDRAINNHDYDLAEQLSLKMAARNLEEGDKNSLRDDYINLMNIYRAQGRYHEAIVINKKYVDLQYEKVPSYERPDIVDVVSFLAQGRFDDVLREFQKPTRLEVQKGPKPNEPNGFRPNYPDHLFRDYYMQTGNYEKAMTYLQARIRYCEQNPADKQDMAEAKNDLAFAYYYMGDDVTAEKLFRDAAGLNTRAIIPFEEDLAKSLTMLGNIAEHHGESAKALNFYQKALKILRPLSYPGLYRLAKADIWNQIGRFQIKQGKPEEAAKAYQEVIGLRQATATATHPNCADAYKGLADAAAAKNELTSATLQATKALAILDASVVPTHPRTAQELVALSSIYLLSGHPEQAAPLDARLETILQKPLGPWKEDFMDTSAFYAGLLRKAGQSAAAERLEQLRAHQRDRR